MTATLRALLASHVQDVVAHRRRLRRAEHFRAQGFGIPLKLLGQFVQVRGRGAFAIGDSLSARASPP